MKTSNDPRHQERIQIIRELFSLDFSKDNPIENHKTSTIMAQEEEIDNLIVEAAPAFPKEKINRIDLAILRLATFELLQEEPPPTKVVVDEAVELAKEYGSDSSPSFVNGVLGKIIDKLQS